MVVFPSLAKFDTSIVYSSRARPIGTTFASWHCQYEQSQLMNVIR